MTKGQRIRLLRERIDMTQETLAIKLKTTKQTISKYEKDIVTNIPSDRIEALAKILNSTPEYILGWEENKKNSPSNDGLTEKQQQLYEFIRSVPDDKAALVLRTMKAILEDD